MKEIKDIERYLRGNTMKKFTILLISILLGIFIIGCDQKKEVPENLDGPWDRRPAILVDGELYLSTGEVLLVELDPDAAKIVTKVVQSSNLPTKEGEINFPMPEAKYVKVMEDSAYVAVLVGQKWEKFVREFDPPRSEDGKAPDEATMHLTADQQMAVDHCVEFIRKSSFGAKDRIDTKRIEIKEAGNAAYESVYGEDGIVDEKEVDPTDWVITIGETSDHDYAVFVCDSITFEVIGYIPIE